MTHAYESLYHLAHALHGCANDARVILQTALVQSGRMIGVEQGCIVEFGKGGRVATIYTIGLPTQGSSDLVQQGLIGFARYSQRSVIVRSLSTDPRYPHLPNLPHTGSAVALPLLHDETVVGALMLLHPVEDFFTDLMTRLLEAAAATTALALVNARRYETAHLQSDQLRHDLTLMTYHDLRTPLHNINGSLGRIGRMLNGSQPPAAAELLGIAQRSVGQMQRMIDTLLDIDQLESGGGVSRRKPVPMGNLLLDALDLIRPMVEEAEQHLICDCGDPLPVLMLDGDMIMRVIANLIENAVKHTPTDGIIRVSAVVAPEGVCISVTDEGTGIAPDMQERIFEKYFRLEDKRRGVGLGLAFCRMAVEAHNGRIWVESPPGAGATFSFVLPV